APLAGGRSVFVVNTYGYPYPAVPAGTPPADPPSAPFAGGMARLDVRADGSGCDLRWTNRAASAALPRLSLADAALYTVVQDGPLDTQAAPLHFAAVDAHTGAVTGRTLMGGGLVDPLQMAGTALGRTYLQGTVTGVTKVTPLP
ncbi:MAG TPA: hypothetical protein VFY17_03035, partial [Pilimelia sp.]|nr:hypothetical protein [Pilimelia sp.]